MDKELLGKLIDMAAGRRPADLVIKNCKVVDVCGGQVTDGDIALCGSLITGIGSYSGLREIDGMGLYAVPGLIDSHVHVESSYLVPEEFGRMVVPRGTTTVIADPHEITNVCGLEGLDYMIRASKGTALEIKWMLPSCVPASPFEHSGAVIDARAMEATLSGGRVLGLGEFMDYPGVIAAEDGALEKLLAARRLNMPIDGHSPGVSGKDLCAYVAAGIRTDHECGSVEELRERLSRGMYVMLRQGSACHDLETLLEGVTPLNARHCLLCTDDCQPKTILELGHLDHHLRLCVKAGIHPIAALQMASLNAAQCYGLTDRGAIAPGLRADIVLVDNLRDFNVKKVFIQGIEAASDGSYLLPVTHYESAAVGGKFHVKDFSIEKLRLQLSGDRVHVMRILPGGVLTRKEIETIDRDRDGAFVYNPHRDIVKAAVVERHQNTGNVAVGLIKGFGLKYGAIAASVAHDSHNIIVTGASDEDMAFAVETLINSGGGIFLVKDRKVIAEMPMPVAGLMSDQNGRWVCDRLAAIHDAAHQALGVSRDVEPIMTLCFMSLPVIPEIKLTDNGLFDVTSQKFISVDA